MAVYFDQNGNLVDTEISESSDVLPPNPFLSPDTADSPYANLLGLPANQDMGYLLGVPETSNAGYLQGVPQTADDQGYLQGVPQTTDDQGYLLGVPDTSDTGFPFAPANRLQGLDLDRFEGVGSLGIANEDDQEQEFLPGQKEESGIMKLIKFLIPGSNLKNFLPKNDPRAIGIQNFYRPYEGLTSTGSIASGIMQGYNPVSGGFLNMITGGKFGKPTNYGLSGAMQRRIENILGRKAPQTDASRAKVAELRNLQLAEMTDRADRGESMGSIGRSTFSGPGMAFERRSGGVSGKGTANERNYGGR
jgi:hypothetical protein|tara:strand:- start:60 stop:974 length:915 start_codon:yes stop_codon:yes gene_type:complete